MPIRLESGHVRYKELKYPFKGFDEDELELYDYIKLPEQDLGNGYRKVLFVFDYVPKEDLKSQRLMGGAQGKTFQRVISLISERIWLKETVKFSWLGCSFNAFRTAGKPRAFQNNAKVAFGKRIEFIISRYKPDVVVLFGRDPVKHFYGEELDLSNGAYAPWLGVPRQKTVKGHTANFYATIGFDYMTGGESPDSALLGYSGKTLANAITNKHRFAVDAERLKNHRSVLVDTIKKFDKLMDSLQSIEGPVAVDTETNNLNRIVNSLLTLQFSKCVDIGYVIPINHRDSPFVGEELKYIKKRLRKYFEGRNKNTYHIYVNAEFDLNQIRSQLKVRYVANKIWDIQGAEFAFDENFKSVKNATGDGYYNLGNLAVQYGFTGYLTAEFGKKDRGSISTQPLNEALIKYCSLDTVVPFAIHQQQLKLAKHIGHDAFVSVVTDQISDMIHGFSKMAVTGNLIDVKYLFHLKTPNSPIEMEIYKLKKQLLASEAVRKCNKRLMKQKGLASKGLFGDVVSDVFSLNKNEHKQMLFFEVLGLEPLSYGEPNKATNKRAGKIDKTFQKHYKDVPEVGMFTELSKAYKLRNAYVNSFIKMLGNHDDFKSDLRIRPRYKYLDVITGRTSASDPNSQQIPTHSELGKHIKRLFIAPKNTLYIKVDYRVHEVRGWALIAFDKALASVFAAAKALRDQYRRSPTPELAKRLKTEADVHVINAAYFFSVLIEKVDKVLRNSVKAVVFGLIYQMAIKTLAKNLDKPLDFTEKLVTNFNKRFPKGMQWIENVKKTARKLFFVENPIGLRRHLWGYALDDTAESGRKIHGEMDRRAVNSPIQGMGAQFMAIANRALDSIFWDILRREKRDIKLQVCNSVHDSLETVSDYSTFLENIGHIEEAMTTKVAEAAKKRRNFEFVVPLEIDFEIGGSLAGCQAWDCSLLSLEEIVYESLKFQKEELNYEIEIKEVMNEIFVEGWSRAPFWMKKQAKNISWKHSYSGVKQRLRVRAEKEAEEKEQKLKAASVVDVKKEKVKKFA